MARSSGSYPHPVIGNGDDVDAAFEVINASFTPTVEDLAIRFRLRISDDEMRGLIRDQKVALSARWTCAATLSSADLDPVATAQHQDGTTYEAWLDQRSVRGDVRVDILLVAAENMPSYSLSRQHPDYGSQVFDVRVGDVLADGGYFEVSAEKLHDPLQPPLSSCFKIVVDDRPLKTIQTDFSNDEQILIRVSQDMAVGLRALGHLPKLQLSLVVLPALIETLNFIERTESDEEAEDLSARGWYGPIMELKSPLSSESSNLVIAQRILTCPLAECLVMPLVLHEEDADD